MKLFGGKSISGHTAQKRRAEEPVAIKEEKFSRLAGFFSEGWKKYRTPLIIVGCVIVVLLAAVLVYSIWEKPPETNDTGLTVVTTSAPVATVRPVITPPPEETQAPEETEPPEETGKPAAVERKDGCYTFVLLAFDQVGANTDTIIVGRMDTENGTLDLVNIPRDTLVNVSWAVKKLNTVLVSERNDMVRFIDHLSGLLGFTVDNYAIVDMRAVEKLVDCIGGIYYYVPRNMNYDDPTQDLHIHISEGYQLLNGENAVKVLRFRVGNEGSGYATGDIGRIGTQQDLLKALASQMLSLGNIPNLDKIIEIVEDYVETDLTANNIAFFAREFLLMKKDNIRFHMASGEGISIRGGSYYELNVEEWLNIINEHLNPYNTDVTTSNLDILRSLGQEGAVSTSGEILPLSTFLDFYNYSG